MNIYEYLKISMNIYVYLKNPPTPTGSRGSALEKRGQEASGGKPAARPSRQVGSWQCRKTSRKHRSEASF